MIFFKHRRSAERDAFSVPRSVQKSIPIKRIYQDGVFQVSGKFSKTWRFFDVNYAVASFYDLLFLPELAANRSHGEDHAF